MLKALPIVGLILGLLLLVIGTWAIRYVWRTTRQELRQDGRRIRIALILIGVTLSILTSAIKYYPDPNTMVYGFPFLSFVFQRRNGQWLDFVGPLTIPALAANAAAGFLLPFIVASAVLRKRRAA